MGDAIFTILKNRRGPLSKSFTLTDGRLQKTAAAEVTDGVATRAAASTIHDLARIVEELSAEEALTFGIAHRGTVRIATQKALASGRAPKGAICRDRVHFSWPKGRGVLMLDIDKAKDGSGPLKAKDFDAMLCRLLPWWSSTARMYRPSASAFIHDAETGEILSGPGSLRCYAIVDKAENIPFVGIAVLDALWKAGAGRIEFSAAGSLLIRTAVDGAVWQPERLDFAGPVVLGPGLSREHHKPWIRSGLDIDTEAVIAAGPGKVTMAAWASNSLEVRKAKHAARPEEKVRRKAVIEDRVKKDVEQGIAEKEARRKWRAALTEQILSGDFKLYFGDAGVATVAEVLKNPHRFDLCRCADPAEPTYANDPRIAQFYFNGGKARPQIFSHAHGGVKYVLQGRA